MRQILVVLAFSIVLPVFGQRNKKEEEPVVPSFTEGIAYTLPRTGIRIYVKTLKEIFEPGPYAQYADQLLGIKEAKTKPSVKWSVVDCRFKTFSEPDPEQIRKAMGKHAALISLSFDGCILGINAHFDQKSDNKAETNIFTSPIQEKSSYSFSNFNETPYIVQGDSSNGYKTYRLGAEQKAVEAARRIYDCRITMYDMSAGRMDEPHPDGEAYKASLELLKTTENNYLSLFIGKTSFEDQTFSFDFIPTTSRGEVVFRFSEEKGVVPASDLSGKPIMLEVIPEKGLVDKYNSVSASANPNAGVSGIYYRMPVTATVNLIQDLKVIANTRITLPQFGLVSPVPEEYLNGTYSILFHAETGALKSITKN